MTFKRRARRFLSARAGWSVLLAWMLFLLSLLVGISVVVGSAINITYFPVHPNGNFDRAIIRVAYFAVIVSGVSALVATILLVLKRRRFASSLVIASWLAIVFFAVQASLLVRPGPEQFEKTVDGQRFVVHWRYGPDGDIGGGSSNQFYVKICADGAGGYAGACHRSTRITISSRSDGVGISRERLEKLERRESWGGYELYVFARRDNEGRVVREILYYVGRDGEGNVTRSMECDFGGECWHKVAFPAYVITYRAAKEELQNAKEQDLFYEKIVESWRVK